MSSLLLTFVTDTTISFSDSFLRLFTEMDAISAICLIVGMALLIIEIFQPGFGTFGVLGAFVVCAGIINRMMNNGDFAMLFTLVFIVLFLSTLGFILMSRVARNEWLNRTPIVKNIEESLNVVPVDFVTLIGKQGKAISSVNPNGKALIEENYYDVISKDGAAIVRGSEIIICSIDGRKIFVQPLMTKTTSSRTKSLDVINVKTADSIKEIKVDQTTVPAKKIKDKDAGLETNKMKIVETRNSLKPTVTETRNSAASKKKTNTSVKNISNLQEKTAEKASSNNGLARESNSVTDKPIAKKRQSAAAKTESTSEQVTTLKVNSAAGKKSKVALTEKSSNDESGKATKTIVKNNED